MPNVKGPHKHVLSLPITLPKEVFMEPTNELVYIVDDEASVGEALSTLLRANGKRVQIFTSGQGFLDFARQIGRAHV